MTSVKWKLQKTTDPQQTLYTSGASKQIRLNPSALQEKSRTICCGLLQHQEDVWVSETGLNIFQCSFPGAFLAPNSSRLLICLLLWLSLRANYVLVKNPFENGVERQPSKMWWRMLKAEIAKSEQEKGTASTACSSVCQLLPFSSIPTGAWALTGLMLVLTAGGFWKFIQYELLLPAVPSL